MRAVNEMAARVLERLAELAELADGEKVAVMLSSPSKGIMPLHVERVAMMEGRELWTVSHTHAQNGDLMRDPEVEFLRVRWRDSLSDWYPLSFRQDGLPIGVRSYVKLDGSLEPVSVVRRRQSDLAIFCGVWMWNMRWQFPEQLKRAKKK